MLCGVLLGVSRVRCVCVYYFLFFFDDVMIIFSPDEEFLTNHTEQLCTWYKRKDTLAEYTQHASISHF